MLEEAVAAALDLPIEDVQATDVRERMGRRLLSTSLEVTVIFKAESKEHLNELRKRMVSEVGKQVPPCLSFLSLSLPPFPSSHSRCAGAEGYVVASWHEPENLPVRGDAAGSNRSS